MKYLTVKVVPNASQTKIKEVMSDGTVKILVSAAAEKGKANQELLRFLEKNYGMNAVLVAGESDRKKLIRLEEK